MAVDVTADHALATYGTLAPGKPNHHQLAGLQGQWCKATVRGHLVPTGWGAALGFPALVLDTDGSDVTVDLFQSTDLPGHWGRLDAFEGADYRRAKVTVTTAHGPVDAWIYVGAGNSPEKP